MRTVSSGIISSVHWRSMGDWPECEITDDDGAKSTWTRELARSVEGLHAQFTFVLHPRKVARPASNVVLTVEIEVRDLRSGPRAPGPGGVGLRMK